MREVVADPAAQSLGDRIMKVNHAGEHGAVSIYTGQIWLAKLTAPHLVAELVEFRSHEQRHRALFAAELERRGRRRCRSYWLCAAGGLALGLITGLLGPGAIAATTVSVETVVLRHLEGQIASLGLGDPEAVRAIQAIVDEEALHHEQSAAHISANQFWYKVLNPIVSGSTELVIWLGMKL